MIADTLLPEITSGVMTIGTISDTMTEMISGTIFAAKRKSYRSCRFLLEKRERCLFTHEIVKTDPQAEYHCASGR
jgi:hypothetical protein